MLKPKCRIVADFNAQPLSSFLINDNRELSFDVKLSPMGPVQGHLTGSDKADCVVIWSRPEGSIAAFADWLNGGTSDEAAILQEVDRFIKSVEENTAGIVVIPSWVSHYPGSQRIVTEMNLRLLKAFERHGRIAVVDTNRWLIEAKRGFFQDKTWYLAKIPFPLEVFRGASNEIYSTWDRLKGSYRKLLILDLDNTMWGGVVGDEGWEALRLGGHDAIGEAHQEFQRAVKRLLAQGTLLAIASKNEEPIVWDAFRKHPEMILRQEDFVAWRINWKDKSENIAEILRELNLTPESAVFIDDSSHERDRVMQSFPKLLVPEWPGDPLNYASAFFALKCFGERSTDEDRGRNDSYRVERVRLKAKESAPNYQEWLQQLGIVAQVEALDEANLVRITQLLNKTNQMNLKTRRLSGRELLDWISVGTRFLYAIRVKDQFGDSGIVGIVSGELVNGIVAIEDFILSCRVFGRELEKTLVFIAYEWARARGAKELHARYEATERNIPCLRFWAEESRFSRAGDLNLFTWNTETVYQKPAQIQLLEKTHADTKASMSVSSAVLKSVK